MRLVTAVPLICLAFLIGACATTSPATALTGQAHEPELSCPAETIGTRERVNWFIERSSDTLLDSLGLAGARPDEVRLLTSPGDDVACAFFNQAYADAISRRVEGYRALEVALYKLRDRYLVATVIISNPAPGLLGMGLDVTDVWTLDLKHIMGYGGG
ncbi:hypothetical protein BH23BAC4_BH23BAC4_03370 [soil metagenome]